METQLNNPSNDNIESKHRRLGALFLIMGWVIIISLVALLVNFGMFRTKSPLINTTPSGTQIIISRDNDYHFRIDGSINGIAVTFLIDTGATSIAIPSKIADTAHLARLSQVNTETASGSSIGYFTKIDKLDIGTIKFNNATAIIIPDMDSNQVLLGMNILQHLNIQQTRDTLIITVPVATH